MPNKVNANLTDYVATRWYRSPELILNAGYGKPADIWAVGCIMGEMADGEPLFNGDNEIDQMYKIQQVLGEFPEELNEYYHKNPKYLGYKFPDLRFPETLEKRYIGKLSKKSLSLMSKMLALAPEERYTAADAILHPYFDEVRDPELESLLKSKQKLSSKSTLRIGTIKDKTSKKYRNKNSVSPHDGGSKERSRERSKPRANRFSELGSKLSGKFHKDNPYKSSSKNRGQKKIGKPPINFKNSQKFAKEMPKEKYLANSSGKMMPSNFSNFYIPFGSDGSTANQYGYHIDIENKSRERERDREETKIHIIPTTRQESDISEEDEVAVIVEGHKSTSRSPVKSKLSPERFINNSFSQKPKSKKHIMNMGSVPAAQIYPNYEARRPYQEGKRLVADGIGRRQESILEDSDSDDTHPYMQQSNPYE